MRGLTRHVTCSQYFAFFIQQENYMGLYKINIEILEETISLNISLRSQAISKRIIH